METDTIVAISTPPGRGALGVVRVSGPQSLAIAGTICSTSLPGHGRARHLRLVEPGGRVIDDVVATVFRRPRSYTGEDMVELSCHGNAVVLNRVVDVLLGLGARAARPGEFTLRGFLEGRFDLTQAEAVVDLVEAGSDAAAGLALAQLEGALGTALRPVRESLLDTAAHIAAVVDFSEEDIPSVSLNLIRQGLTEASMAIGTLLEGARRGQIVSHGVTLALVGPANAGKSSLFNALLARNRAIVTAIPGTTRDTLEEDIQIDGILFHLVDTAGMEETADPVELLGIERSGVAMEGAEVILLIIDASEPLSPSASRALRRLATSRRTQQRVVVLNKTDLPSAVSSEDVLEVTREASHSGPGDTIAVVRASALEVGGLTELTTTIRRLVLNGQESDGFLVSNSRHIQELEIARSSLDRARRGLEEEVPLDLLGLDIGAGLKSLGAILGSEVNDEILDRVFSTFCIGK